MQTSFPASIIFVIIATGLFGSSMFSLTEVTVQRAAAMGRRIFVPPVVRGNVTTPGLSPTPSPISSTTPIPIPTEPAADGAAYKAEVIRLINEERVSKGCPVAVPNELLATGAQAWTERMVETLEYQHSPVSNHRVNGGGLHFGASPY
ncbi:MAG: hypothetical protein M3R24_28375 [Chloroflexota bacterium]|nr:hypothetical protein [Chloroflexota bacterium]